MPELNDFSYYVPPILYGIFYGRAEPDDEYPHPEVVDPKLIDRYRDEDYEDEDEDEEDERNYSS